ncbi:hypothetical protein [Martelella radicis]|uniref:Uncharacterized protein n=1 Tax=Martelella radicis TaxID=1397476 RepID=A0A7W6KN16_9HYPH|nr:hypothetical protein [Martelella radicis]MBB4124334.1 hypothetical protein [Martelella radicis]
MVIGIDLSGACKSPIAKMLAGGNGAGYGMSLSGTFDAKFAVEETEHLARLLVTYVVCDRGIRSLQWRSAQYIFDELHLTSQEYPEILALVFGHRACPKILRHILKRKFG